MASEGPLGVASGRGTLLAEPESIPAVEVTLPAALAPKSGVSRRALVVQLAMLVLSGIIIALLLARTNMHEATTAAARVPALTLAFVILLNIPATLLRAERGRVILKQMGHTVPLGRMSATQLAGQTLSNMTPGAAGDFVRAYIWHRADAVPVSTGLVAVLFERLFSLVQLLTFGFALTAPLYLHGNLVAGAVALSVVGLVAPYAVMRTARVLVRRRALPETGAAGALMNRLRRGLRRVAVLFLGGRLSLLFTLLTVGTFAVSGLQISLLTGGVADMVPLWSAIGIYGLSQALGSLSSLPFGIGPADAVVITLLVSAGTPAAAAAAVAILIRITMTLPLGLSGAIAYVVLGRRIGTGATA